MQSELDQPPQGSRPTQYERPVLVVADPIHETGIERLKQRFHVVLPSEQDTVLLEQAEVVVVRTLPITEAWLERTPRLKLIAKHGSGVDNIDMTAATQRGIIVANTPGGANATAVAEGAVTLMLAVLRRICDMDRLVREGRFSERWSILLGDLTGRRLGLVGFGQIARNVARICGSGFGMQISAYDPFVPREDMAALGVSKVDDLLTLMGNDVISIHIPFSPKTKNLIGEKELGAMPPTSIIVNTSRGGIVDEAALARALAAGEIGGAGIDVFDQEPPSSDHPLLRLSNVVLSPHVAGVTSGSMQGMALAVAEVVEKVMNGGRPATVINPETLGASQ